MITELALIKPSHVTATWFFLPVNSTFTIVIQIITLQTTKWNKKTGSLRLIFFFFAISSRSLFFCCGSSAFALRPACDPTATKDELGRSLFFVFARALSLFFSLSSFFGIEAKKENHHAPLVKSESTFFRASLRASDDFYHWKLARGNKVLL